MVNLPKVVKKTLADVLLQEGLVPQNQLSEAVDKQKFGHEQLGAVLLQMGVVSELELARAYCKQYNLPFVDASRYSIPKEVTDLIPVEEMQQKHFIVLDKIGKVLLVAVSEVPAPEVLEAWEGRTGSVIFAFVTTQGNLDAALRKCYFKGGKPPASPPTAKQPAQPAAPAAKTEAPAKAPKTDVAAPAKPAPKTAVTFKTTIRTSAGAAPVKPAASQPTANQPTTRVDLPAQPAAPAAAAPAAPAAPAAAAPGGTTQQGATPQPGATQAPQLSSAGRVEFKLVTPKKSPPAKKT